MIARLRAEVPGIVLRTTMITGFPGETEEEFAESLEFLRRCGFAKVHVFPYSRRPGTPADRLPGQISRQEKERRSAEAIRVAQTLADACCTAMIGSVQPVLFEQPEEGMFAGHAPNYVKVYAPGEGLKNALRQVRIEGLFGEGVCGTIIE